MGNVLVDDAYLYGIADALREKHNTEKKYLPSEMENAVRAIESGGSDEEFVGVKLSEFVGSYHLPRVADARALGKIIDSITNEDSKTFARGFITAYLFANTNGNLNGGLYAELEEVYLPNGLTGLSYTFYFCSKLKKIHGDLSSINNLGATFYGCKSLTDFPYLPNLKSTGGNVFRDCIGLTKANLYGNVTSLNSSTFLNCTNLLDIYVPWSEGEIANAPWGATNATIHYNTVYDENHNPIV